MSENSGKYLLLEDFPDESEYDFMRNGCFGTFVSGNSFPIDYILTNFKAEELSKLTFARDIKPEKLDFDLLIQRDIDDERVRKKIEPYLSMKDSKETEIKSKVVFFPPLLAAIIPTKNKGMQNYYPKEFSYRDGRNVIREWKGLFKLSFIEKKGSSPINTTLDDGEVVGVKLSPVMLEAKLAQGAAYGANFVVIDGQHRLAALKKVYSDSPELLESVVVPVCILYSPNSTEYKKDAYKPLNVPTVTEIFRHLFVDVNTTMELVGGHFNILLSDENMGSIACRRFCGEVLSDESLGEVALATIEWNTKSKKDSTIITKNHSITSIGVIEKALRENLSKNTDLVVYLLNLTEVEDKLTPPDMPLEDFPKVEWERFSYTQKKVIEDQILKYLVPSLKELFFGIKDYKSMFDIFKKQIEKLLSKSKSVDADAKSAELLLNHLLEYKPIPDTKDFIQARILLDKFEDEINSLKESNVCRIADKAIFQRGLIEAWLLLLSLTSDYGVDPVQLTKAYTFLVNHVLRDNGKLLAVDKEYMQHAVYNNTNVNPRNEVKSAIASLIYAFLGKRALASTFVGQLKVAPEKSVELTDKLAEEGQKRASNFLGHYQKQRFTYFKGSYVVNFTLSQEERDKLSKAEAKQKEDSKAARLGKIKKAEIDHNFDKYVGDHIKCNVDVAAEKLKKSLEYDAEILLPSVSNGSMDADDE